MASQGSSLPSTIRQSPTVGDSQSVNMALSGPGGRLAAQYMGEAIRGLQGTSLPSTFRQSPSVGDRGAENMEDADDHTDSEDNEGSEDDESFMDVEDEYTEADYAKASAAMKIVVAFARDELQAEYRRADSGTFPAFYQQYAAMFSEAERDHASTFSPMTIIMDADDKTPLISQRAQVNTCVILEELPWLADLTRRRKSMPYMRAAGKTARAAWKKVKHDLAKLISGRVRNRQMRKRIAEAIMDAVFQMPEDGNLEEHGDNDGAQETGESEAEGESQQTEGSQQDGDPVEDDRSRDVDDSQDADEFQGFDDSQEEVDDSQQEGDDSQEDVDDSEEDDEAFGEDVDGSQEDVDESKEEAEESEEDSASQEEDEAEESAEDSADDDRMSDS